MAFYRGRSDAVRRCIFTSASWSLHRVLFDVMNVDIVSPVPSHMSDRAVPASRWRRRRRRREPAMAGLHPVHPRARSPASSPCTGPSASRWCSSTRTCSAARRRRSTCPSSSRGCNAAPRCSSGSSCSWCSEAPAPRCRSSPAARCSDARSWSWRAPTSACSSSTTSVWRASACRSIRSRAPWRSPSPCCSRWSSCGRRCPCEWCCAADS